jgi:very-short-patch-repair endonuclease
MTTTPGEQAFEEISLADVVEGFAKQRVELVQRAAEQWIRALRDLTARNNLLRYKDLRAGTLDFQGASDRALCALLGGKTVRLSALFREPEAREAARRRLRTIHVKARENLEERGVKTLTIACGLSSWENKRAAWEPCAPVLLRRAELRPLGAAQDDFELSLTDEMELNPTLVHLLKADFDCELDSDSMLDRVNGTIDEPWELEAVYERMSGQTSQVPGFRVEPRMVLANFAYTKLPMVSDLEASFDELVAHDLIAAMAGDSEAIETLRESAPSEESIPSPDATALADEFLVLDADCSQNYAINAVLAGQNLIIKGPPGTGKSQTIANMIATLIARGKRVLFVTEKRAAIEAVLKRLHAKQLDELVLDLHGGVASRKAFIAAVADALTASASAGPVDDSADLAVLEKRRSELNTHVQALHKPREPWGISVYEARAQLLGLEASANKVRFSGDVLLMLTAAVKNEVVEQLREFCRLGGIGFAESDNPWAHSPIAIEEEARSSYTTLEGLRRTVLPQTLAALRDAVDQTGLPPGASVAAFARILEAWGEISQTLQRFRVDVYEGNLEQLRIDLAPAASGVKRVRASLFSPKYRAARAQLRSLLVDGVRRSDHELRADCDAILAQKARWRSLGGEQLPTHPENIEGLDAAYGALHEQVVSAERFSGQPGLLALDPRELERHLDALLAEQQTVANLPRLRGLEDGLMAYGLGDLMASLHAQRASEHFAVDSFEHSWYRSVLDRVSLDDPDVGGFVAEKQDRAVEDFKAGDRKHIEVSAARIRRLCAETAVRTRDEQRDQEAVIRRQIALKRKHMPVRDLIIQTSDVLLSLQPCWAMSPLLVSQLLPAKQLFDIVVFDEASQVTPADAMPAILRGRRLVVAGDDHQLPPTAFFASDNASDEDDEETLGSSPLGGTENMESILDAVTPLLPFRTLQWHYRSQDEQLIAFSNAYIYDRQLTTFPGVGDEDVLRYVQASWDPQAETNSPSPEVQRVVELIFEHAESRPQESLGVIAMGIKHANRIEEACIRRMRENPALEEKVGGFFAEDREERFFVKNLERVQGDERDAIILSIGYGKNQRGDLPYRFGPLLSDGGERRLNVAVTRAKRRITLVSSFSSADMDPDRSSVEGVKLLRSYLQYVESGGTSLGDVIREKPALNPFEVDVRDTLERRGLRLTPQLGTSGYWIDYAVHHPEHPGRYVLAIECDGATYHSSQSARDRDRLRQEQLERVGWRFCRIWSGEWFHHKEKAVEKILSAYANALEAAEDPEDSTELSEQQISAMPDSPFRPGAWRQDREGNGERKARPRPNIRSRQPITAYNRSELVALVMWIESDERLRTEDELLEAVMQELKFARRGSRIVDAIQAAIRAARTNDADRRPSS